MPALPLLLAVGLSLTLSMAAPLGLAVFGFMLLGLAHNLAELRYVLGRYLGPRVAPLVLPLLLVMGVRAFGGEIWSPDDARRVEIGVVYAVLGGALLLGRGRWAERVGLGLLVGLGAGASLSWPREHFLVLSHLHNLMPALFLLLHTREGRARTLGLTLLWAVLVPALILSGALDGLLPEGGIGPVGPLDRPEALTKGWLPRGVSPMEATRVVATFSFLQGMHYAIWLWVLPQASPREEGGPRWLHAFRSRWLTALVAGGTLLALPFWWRDYMGSFAAYGALASFHVLVEFPVLLAWVLGRGERGSGAREGAL